MSNEIELQSQILNLREQLLNIEKENFELKHKPKVENISEQLGKVWLAVTVAREVDRLPNGQDVALDNVFVRVESASTNKSFIEQFVSNLASQSVEEVQGIKCLCQRSIIECDLS